MELLGEMPECLWQRYLRKEEAETKVAPHQPAHKAERYGAFSFYGHRLLSLYRESTLGSLTLIFPFGPHSSFFKYLGGLGVKPPVGPVGQTAKDLI